MSRNFGNAARRCTTCGIRWPQGRGGICRRCARSNGDTRTDIEKELEFVAKLDSEKLAAQPEAELLPPREVVIGRQTYLVMWP